MCRAARCPEPTSSFLKHSHPDQVERTAFWQDQLFCTSRRKADLTHLSTPNTTDQSKTTQLNQAMSTNPSELPYLATRPSKQRRNATLTNPPPDNPLSRPPSGAAARSVSGAAATNQSRQPFMQKMTTDRNGQWQTPISVLQGQNKNPFGQQPVAPPYPPRDSGGQGFLGSRQDSNFDAPSGLKSATGKRDSVTDEEPIDDELYDVSPQPRKRSPELPPLRSVSTTTTGRKAKKAILEPVARATQQSSPEHKPLDDFGTEFSSAEPSPTHAESQKSAAARNQYGQPETAAFTDPLDLPRRPFHRYTIHHIDLRTGKPAKKLSKVLHSQIIQPILRELPPATPMSKFVYLCTEPWTLPVLTAVLSEGGLGEVNAPVEHVVMRAHLYTLDELEKGLNGKYLTHGELRNMKALAATHFDNVPPKHHLLPTDLQKYNADLSRVHAVSGDGKSDALLKALREICGYDEQAAKDSRAVAMFFRHDVVDCKDLAKIVEQTESDKQKLMPTLDAVIATSLEEEARRPNAVDNITIIGNRAYAPAQRITCGVQKRRGVEGKLTYSRNGKVPVVVSLKRVVGTFFDNCLISDFIIDFFGHTAAHGLDQAMLKRAESLLRGKQVVVAVSKSASKQLFTIQGLSETARIKPVAVNGTKLASATLLKYPDMPLVNVGSGSKPFFYPAELCRLQPDQPFHGELPVLESDSFDIWQPRAKEPFEPKEGDPFKDQQTDDFKLVFVKLSDVRSDASVITVNAAAWKSFKCEMGERFNGKLKAAVEHSTLLNEDNLTIRYGHGFLAELSRQAAGAGNLKKVLIIAVPSTVPSTAVDDLRKLCDLQLGVQCCIVDAKEVSKRYHPLVNDEMVKYTGQVVRKMLSRALIAGKENSPEHELGGGVTGSGAQAPSDGEDAKVRAVAATKSPHAAIFGIHVVKLKDFRGKDAFHNVAINTDHLYHVSVVSASSYDEIKVHTTHNVVLVSTTADHSLSERITQCFASHAATGGGGLQSSLQKVAIYLSGLPMADKTLLQDIRMQIEALMPSEEGKVSGTALALIAMAPKSELGIVDGEDCVPFIDPRDVMGRSTDTSSQSMFHTPMSSQQLHQAFRSDHQLHERVLSHVFHRPDGMKHGGEVDIPADSWHVVYQQSEMKSDGRMHIYYPCLEKRALPDILLLAQKASKRGRLYIVKKDERIHTKPDACPYEVLVPHESLEHTLYYL